MSDESIAANRLLWDELTAIHERSAFYDVEGFLAGGSSLTWPELDELGPEVAGKRLLHLQCHFGLDTLSWARMGATVTGVDFSSQAIELALSGGRVIVIGVAQGSVSVPLHLMQDREVALTGSAMYVGDDVRGAIALMERGVIPVDELVTATFDLGDAVEAFEVARGREQVKVQLTVRPAD